MFITVPADMSLWTDHDVSHGHYRRYDVESLRRVWEALPVRELGLSPFNARLYPLVRVARTLSRWRGRPAGDAGSDLRLPSRPVNTALHGIFAGERRRLLRNLRGGRPYRRGVSLVAVLAKEG